MYLLILFFCLLVIITFLDLLKFDATTKVIIYFSLAFFLILFAAFREGDADFYPYIKIFNQCPDLFSLKWSDYKEVHGEYGYLLLNSLVKTLGGGYRILFLVVAFASVLLTVRYFLIYSPYPLISVLVYFSQTYVAREMMQIRSGLAAAIALYGIRYIQERRFFKFSFLILLASTFHSAVLILFLAYIFFPLFAKSKHNFWSYIVLIMGFILGIIFNQDLLFYLFNQVFKIPAVSMYMAFGEDHDFTSSLGLLNPVLIKNTLLALLFIWNAPQLKERIKCYDTIKTLLILSSFWLATFNNFSIIAARIATFFSIVEPIAIAILILLLSKLNKLWYWSMIIIYCIIFFTYKLEYLKYVTFFGLG